MLALSIETTCDETAFALGEISKNKIKILHSEIASQISIHQPFGGVVPNLSAREHLKNFPILLKKLLQKTQIKLEMVEVFSVANGPGLIPALLVGVSLAKTLAYFFQKPLIPINHLEGHIYSAFIDKNYHFRDKMVFPILALIVSGGHTELVLMKESLKYKIIGETLDDASGESFDKVAKMLNLGYPGGPIISSLAEGGNKKAFAFPRPLTQKANFDFSFSGLKTAVLYTFKKKLIKNNQYFSQEKIKDLVASFQEAVIETLFLKTKKACERFNPRSVLLVGGVSANQELRKRFMLLENKKQKVFYPSFALCGDNASMQIPVVFQKIAKFGLKNYSNGWKNVNARTNWRVDEK